MNKSRRFGNILFTVVLIIGTIAITPFVELIIDTAFFAPNHTFSCGGLTTSINIPGRFSCDHDGFTTIRTWDRAYVSLGMRAVDRYLEWERTDYAPFLRSEQPLACNLTLMTADGSIGAVFTSVPVSGYTEALDYSQAILTCTRGDLTIKSILEIRLWEVTF